MFRSDRLKEHYISQVIWTEKGHNDPAPLYTHAFRSSTNELQRSHTKYFLDIGYTRPKMPKYIVVELSSNFPVLFLPLKAWCCRGEIMLACQIVVELQNLPCFITSPEGMMLLRRDHACLPDCS